MSTSHWFGWLGGAALIAFVVFAFRQGMKVKPDGRGDAGYGGGYPGGGDGHFGDGGGHAGHG